MLEACLQSISLYGHVWLRRWPNTEVGLTAALGELGARSSATLYARSSVQQLGRAAEPTERCSRPLLLIPVTQWGKSKRTQYGPLADLKLHNSSIKSFKLETVYTRVPSYYQSMIIKHLVNEQDPTVVWTAHQYYIKDLNYWIKDTCYTWC